MDTKQLIDAIAKEAGLSQDQTKKVQAEAERQTKER